MTCITNIIITTAIQDGAWMNSDHGSIDVLNDYLHKHYQGTRLHSVYEHAGGRKHMSCDVFMAAVDYLDVDEFIECFHRVPWDKPNQVQLFLRPEGQDLFETYQPKKPSA